MVGGIIRIHAEIYEAVGADLVGADLKVGPYYNKETR